MLGNGLWWQSSRRPDSSGRATHGSCSEAAGKVSVTRGRNLSAKAIGGALVPGGVFIFGNAKDRMHDHCELYLIIDGPDWAYTLRLDPNSGEAAHRFAQNVRLTARQAPTPEAPKSTRPQA